MILHFATNENDQPEVVYQSVDGGMVYTQPALRFFGNVPWEDKVVARFTRVEYPKKKEENQHVFKSIYFN